jgi:hypothetical protein
MLTFSISYPDMIKFSYFADTIARGDRGEREGDLSDNFIVFMMFSGGRLEGSEISERHVAISTFTINFCLVGFLSQP